MAAPDPTGKDKEALSFREEKSHPEPRKRKKKVNQKFKRMPKGRKKKEEREERSLGLPEREERLRLK